MKKTIIASALIAAISSPALAADVFTLPDGYTAGTTGNGILNVWSPEGEHTMHVIADGATIEFTPEGSDKVYTTTVGAITSNKEFDIANSIVNEHYQENPELVPDLERPMPDHYTPTESPDGVLPGFGQGEAEGEQPEHGHNGDIDPGFTQGPATDVPTWGEPDDNEGIGGQLPDFTNPSEGGNNGDKPQPEGQPDLPDFTNPSEGFDNDFGQDEAPNELPEFGKDPAENELPNFTNPNEGNMAGENDQALSDDIQDTNDKLDQTNDKLDSVADDLNDKIDSNKEHQDQVSEELGNGIGVVNDKVDNVATESNTNDKALAQYIEQVNAQTNKGVAANSAAIEKLDHRVSKNEANINKLFGEVNRLDERIDTIGATAQAVTAARPQLGANQTSAVGVGLGYMGSATALSVGYAHQINVNWSANANVAATMGVEDNDFSVGAGVQYAW